MQDRKNEINDFITEYEKIFQEIKNSSFKSDKSPLTTGRTFRRILYVCVIDSLAMTVYPEVGKNRERFTKFLKKFTDYKYWDNISSPQVYYWIKHVFKIFGNEDEDVRTDLENMFSDLMKYIESIIDKWGEWEVPEFSVDPQINQIEKLWPKGFQKLCESSKNKKIKDLKEFNISFFTHANLFYSNRNFLVHGNMDRSFPATEHQTVPFYINFRNMPETREIVYPEKFLEDLCIKALRKLKDYYTKKKINPFQFFTYDSSWLAKG
jgi:hypothetical protein